MQPNISLHFTVYNLKSLLDGFAWLANKSPDNMNEDFIESCKTADWAEVNWSDAERTITFSNSGRHWDLRQDQFVIATMVATVCYAIKRKTLNETLKEFQRDCDNRLVTPIAYNQWRDIVTITSLGTEDSYIYFIPIFTVANRCLVFDSSNKKEGIHVVVLNNDFKMYLEKNGKYPSLYYPWQRENKREPLYTFTSAPKESNNDNKIKNEKENNETMNMPNVNFDFGPCGDAISLSPYGLAIKSRDGKWLTYNPQAGNTVDVTGFTFDFKGMIYKVPVAIADIKVGDMIMHQQRPMFVTAIDGNNISTIDIIVSEAKNIVPVTNPFGFNFVTKITSLMNLGGTTPDPNNPFGNIMPMMIWSEILNGSEENGRRGEGLFGGLDIGKMMMISAMTGQQNPFGNMFNFGNLNFNPNNENK